MKMSSPVFKGVSYAIVLIPMIKILILRHGLSRASMENLTHLKDHS